MAGPAAVLTALRTLRRGSLSVRLRASHVCSPPWSAPPARALQLWPVLCAGHNKWSKVKHIKGPKDDARARVFMKLTMMIKGGANPDMNLNLAQILEQCRSKNMPKASIETAIKSASKPLSQHVFEARGPGGCLLLIEILTDSNSRSHQEIKRLLIKNGGALSEGARHNFNKRGMVVVPGQNIATERALELAIEAGAEDIKETEDEEGQPLLQFVCETTDVGKVRTSLQNSGMQITSSGMEFVPRVVVNLNEDLLIAASTLIDALSDYPDVVRIWDNIQADS
uniref:Translational activator of cytochrome c oxidase 1 n=1 Tax=Takifugu rubripes TaxID=31033 RepID=A0A674NS06_TAKRU